MVNRSKDGIFRDGLNYGIIYIAYVAEEQPEYVTNCLNCGFNPQSAIKYCPKCGQEFKNPEIRFKDVIVEFLGDYFTFDSKFFQSFIPLLTRPGQLTADYISGKKVRFIPPVRLFLFVSILFFLVLSNSFRQSDFKILGDTFSLNASPSDSVLANLDSLQQVVLKNAMADSLMHIVDSLKEFKSPKEIAEIVYPGESPINKMFLAQGIRLSKDGGKSFVNYLMGKGTLVILFIVPIFALILKLLYVRRRKFYNQHLIFSFHFHAYALMVLTLILLLKVITGLTIFWFIILLLPVYLFLALRKVYGQGWRKLILKHLILLWAYFVITLPVVFIIVIMAGFFLF